MAGSEPHFAATLFSADMSTTAMSVAARDADGLEVFTAIPIRGATTWHDAPGFDLAPVPSLLLAAIDVFRREGWSFLDDAGTLCFSIRQHDMVLLDSDGGLLMPALSWQCNAAAAEVHELQGMGIESIVGTIEERFILPKLLWVLRQEPALRERVAHVMTSGDYIAWKLTSAMRLSTSDALSNGLLNATRELASDAIAAAGLDPTWFPPVIQSGDIVGTIEAPGAEDDAFSALRACFHPSRWSVAAGLGDNHAGAVGCGLADEQTIVISAGSSGTVTRCCCPDAQRHGETLGFEYFDNTLLLLMLADCAVWYDRFLTTLDGSEATDHEAANAEAMAADLDRLQPVTHETRDGTGVEIYPDGFDALDRGLRIASTQYAIAVALLRHVRTATHEVIDADAPVHRFLLTGGLIRSPFFQAVLRAGIEGLCPGATVEVSSRTDRLAFQSATYGALINAAVAGGEGTLADVIAAWCPRRPCAQLEAGQQASLAQRLLRDVAAPATS